MNSFIYILKNIGLSIIWTTVLCVGFCSLPLMWVYSIFQCSSLANKNE